jgi:hypothetical protein
MTEAAPPLPVLQGWVSGKWHDHFFNSSRAPLGVLGSAASMPTFRKTRKVGPLVLAAKVSQPARHFLYKKMTAA